MDLLGGIIQMTYKPSTLKFLNNPWKVLPNQQVILNIEPEIGTIFSYDEVKKVPANFTFPRPIVFFYGDKAVAEHIVELHNNSLTQCNC